MKTYNFILKKKIETFEVIKLSLRRLIEGK